MEVTNTNARFTKGGRPKSDPADIDARRRAFQKLRKRLGMTRADLAALTGLTPGTIGNYCSPRSANVAPTWKAIGVMYAEAIHRAKAAAAIAEDAMFRAEIDLQNLERQGMGPQGLAVPVLIHEGVPIHGTFKHGMYRMRYWYSVVPCPNIEAEEAQGMTFDVRQLPGWQEGRPHIEIIEEAIDAGLLSFRSVDEAFLDRMAAIANADLRKPRVTSDDGFPF
ncbi:helix-turn-helix domain-containing protein [Aliihoeflea aestuarii]|uniref:helix-turn-helix domain-containing protein n=1 Tax=Aliihoeflea aestuarii TaxID=453840 RepID=UPI002092E4DF|nr:helix-turn-helix transcriptional regulator [Aliihoeflea aestuarii]MCO6389937.1 helix-turn-helix domain-containing protein [Aliihoeflea aestuarii]